MGMMVDELQKEYHVGEKKKIKKDPAGLGAGKKFLNVPIIFSCRNLRSQNHEEIMR